MRTGTGYRKDLNNFISTVEIKAPANCKYGEHEFGLDIDYSYQFEPATWDCPANEDFEFNIEEIVLWSKSGHSYKELKYDNLSEEIQDDLDRQIEEWCFDDMEAKKDDY